MWRRILLVFIFIQMTSWLFAQTSLIGGANTHLNNSDFHREIRYFAGLEFKINVWEKFQPFFSPQYNELKSSDYLIRSVFMPIGLSYRVNEMWDERTILFRIIDINIGGYGGYNFKILKGEESVTDTFTFYDYGIHASTKFRMFIFYPMYLSFNYGLVKLKEENIPGFNNLFIQAGLYIPVSTLLKNY